MEKIKKAILNQSVQKGFGWCNVHCLINIFGNDKFEKFLKIDKYKGCGIEDIRDMISVVYKNRGLSIVCEINEAYGSIPKELVWNIVSNSTHPILGLAEKQEDFIPVAPYILSIDSPVKDSRHAIAVMNCNGVIVVSDPYWNEMKIVNSKEELFSIIKNVTVIERPTVLDSQSWLLLNAECLDYASDAINTLITIKNK